MNWTHPDWRCPGCNRPLEPLAAIRTYHAGCDPYARIERLEKAARKSLEAIRSLLDNPHIKGDAAVLVNEAAVMCAAVLAEKGE